MFLFRQVESSSFTNDFPLIIRYFIHNTLRTSGTKFSFLNGPKLKDTLLVDGGIQLDQRLTFILLKCFEMTRFSWIYLLRSLNRKAPFHNAILTFGLFFGSEQSSL